MGVHPHRLSGRLREAVVAAAQEALKSVETFRLGAVVVHNKRVVAKGRNRNDNSCGLNSIHAEVDAVFNLAPRRKGLHLVVVRLLRNGDTACSKPCASCRKAVARRGVAKVTYTTGDPSRPLATMTVP